MRRVFALLIAMVVCMQTATIASEGNSDGTEFRFSCLPTLHGNADSLFLVFNSPYLASGSIEYVSSKGVSVRKPFAIGDSRRAVYVAIPRSEVELQGMHRDSSDFLADQSERVVKQQVISIHADSAVSASVLINGSAGSCVTPLIPLASCGHSYVVSSAASRVLADSVQKVSAQKTSPSQFVVIASEDATTITLNIKGRSSRGAEGAQTIQLNANECYLVQGAADTTAFSSDLSATQILANKPIVVISGHHAAQIPSRSGFANPASRAGSLMQQLFSVDRWGKEFVLVPTTTTEATLRSGRELVRVYAIQDNTQLYIDGQTNRLLKNGEYVDLELYDAHVLNASKAVELMQYSANDGPDNTLLGNASMFNVLSTQHFAKEHTVCALQPKLSSGKTFTSQYLMVIAPSSAISSVLYDGEPAANNVTNITDGSYSYFIRKIADGIHSVSCDSACGVYVYGFAADRRYVTSYDVALPIRAYMKPSIRVPDQSARIGDTVNIRVVVDSLKLPPAILGLQPASFSFDLCFNSTVLTPAEASKRGPILNGMQMIHVADTMSQLTSSSTVFNMDFICGLGDAVESKIQVDNLNWYTQAGDTILLDYQAAFGSFKLENVWRDHDGSRLVNPQPGDISVSVSPNPVKGRAFFTLSTDITSTIQPTLALYNTMGEIVKNFSDEVKDFDHFRQFIYGMEDFVPGVYYLRFAIGEKSAVIMVVNE